MMKVIRLLIAALFLVVAATADSSVGTLYGTIHPRRVQSLKRAVQLRSGGAATGGPVTIRSTARVTIHKHALAGEAQPNPVAVALTSVDGSFSFHNLPLGFYSMTVDNYNDLIFPSYQLEVLKSAKGGVRCRVIDNERTPVPLRGGTSAEDPVEVEAIASHSYFIPREEYSIWSFFKNPTLIMMVVMFGMMGLTQMFPKEELRQSMKEMTEAMDATKKSLNLAPKE